MILNLQTSQITKINETQYELKFHLPKLYFNADDLVQVNEIGIHWAKPVSSPSTRLLCTLIDKGPLNLSQQLLFIPLSISNFTFYSPTHIQPYKIQRSELDSSQFLLESSEKVEIKKVYLQLYFSNARIQQIHSKSIQA